MTVAKRIGTFETSILPYEDCCTPCSCPAPGDKAVGPAPAGERGAAGAGEMLDAAIAGREIMPLTIDKCESYQIIHRRCCIMLLI